jgi:hypothetical protein
VEVRYGPGMGERPREGPQPRISLTPVVRGENRDPRAAAAAAERHMDNALRVLRLLMQVVVVGG